MRVAVYGIAKDEEANVDGWLASAADADVIVLADTGSTDRTLERARKRRLHNPHITVHEVAVVPWRFDDAYNAALALVPADIDVCVCLDLDCRLPDNWRQILDAQMPTGPTPTAGKVWMEADGLRWRRPLVHSRRGWRYRFPLFELLTPATAEHQHVDLDLTLDHQGGTRSQADEHRDRNLALLEQGLVETPDELLRFYYGRELMYAGRHAEAIVALTAHATGPAFAASRSESWIYVGDCMLELGDEAQVSPGPYRMAAETAPWRREPWIKVAELARKQRRFAEALDAIDTALAIEEPNWYFNWPWAWGWHPLDERALALHGLGRHDEAIEWGERAVAVGPEQPHLRRNLGFYAAARDAFATT